jgi:hypothetical protein
MRWTTTERRHVQRVYLWGLKGPPDRGHALDHPYGRSQKVDGDGRSCEGIDTTRVTVSRTWDDIVGIEGLVAEGGFEPPTKGL